MKRTGGGGGGEREGEEGGKERKRGGERKRKKGSDGEREWGKGERKGERETKRERESDRDMRRTRRERISTEGRYRGRLPAETQPRRQGHGRDGRGTAEMAETAGRATAVTASILRRPVWRNKPGDRRVYIHNPSQSIDL